MAYDKKTGGNRGGNSGGERRAYTPRKRRDDEGASAPVGFRDGQPVYRGGNSDANSGGGRRDGYAPRSNEGKRDGYAPRSNEGKRDGYAPRSNEGKRDGYAPRSNDGKRDGYAPRSNEGRRDGYAPRSNEGRRDGYAPRSNEGKRDDYAPRSNDGKRDGYAPRSNEGRRDGYAPRSNEGRRGDGYAPRSNEGKRDGYAPRSNEGKRDGYAPRYDKDARNKDGKDYSKDNKSYYRKSDSNHSNAPYERGGKPSQPQERKPQTAPVGGEEAMQDELPYLVMGRNAVREAIKSGRSIDKIFVSKDPDGSLREIMNLARDRNIRLDEVERGKLDELCLPFGHGGKTGNHQGIVAQVPGVEYCDLSDMLNDAKAKGQKPFIVLLDGIEDPHNLGSIIRSAVCAGAHGVVIPKRRAVSVTAAASKASAGAVEYCKVARVSNLAGAIDRLKDEGLWIAGGDMEGKPMSEARMEGALALVIGGEGKGISHLVKEKCDFLVKIPLTGPIDSLNASVAAAVLMFEKRRQDGLRA